MLTELTVVIVSQHMLSHYAVYLKLYSAVSQLYLSDNERKKITCNKYVKTFSGMVGGEPIFEGLL